MHWVSRKVRLLTLVLLTFSCMGCAKQNTNVTMQETPSAVDGVSTVELNSDEEPVVIKTSGSPVFNYRDELPLISGGKSYGLVSIKQVEKVGINDWSNITAVQNNIGYSYSINLEYRLDENSELLDGGSLICEAFIESSDGTCFGSPCCVGWSGFPSSVVLVGNNLSGRLEVGVQPERKLTEDMNLVLKFKDSDKMIFDDIVIGNKIFQNAVKGPSLLEGGESKEITSINGAKYSVQIFDVFSEQQVNGADQLGDYYMFSYRVSYLKRPVRKIQVDKFDQYDNMKIASSLVVGVIEQGSAAVLYESDDSARRFQYYDAMDAQDAVQYVTTNVGYADVGENLTSVTNRLKPTTTSTEPAYLRFQIEFPEEALARDPDQLMQFNGRFLVYQVAPSERKLKWKYDHE